VTFGRTVQARPNRIGGENLSLDEDVLEPVFRLGEWLLVGPGEGFDHFLLGGGFNRIGLGCIQHAPADENVRLMSTGSRAIQARTSRSGRNEVIASGS
jgi:hypothetical protein